MFYTVRLRKENRKDRKLGRKFSLLCSLFYPPKSGEKCGEKSAVKTLLHKYTLSPTPHSWPNDFCPQIILITFASSHPYLHSTPMSRFSSLSLSLSLSLSFFFFFKVTLSSWYILLFLVFIILYINLAKFIFANHIFVGWM